MGRNRDCGTEDGVTIRPTSAVLMPIQDSIGFVRVESQLITAAGKGVFVVWRDGFTEWCRIIACQLCVLWCCGFHSCGLSSTCIIPMIR